jgi:glycosyltransferase involved in cell wall biosynthesis
MDIGFASINLGVRGSTRRIVELSNHLIKRGHRVTVYLPEGEKCDWLKLDAPIKKLEKLTEKNDFLFYYGHRDIFTLMERAKVKKRFYYVLGIGNENTLNEKLQVNFAKGTPIFEKEGNGTFFHALYNPNYWGIVTNCFTITDWMKTNLRIEAWTVQGGIDHDVFYRMHGPTPYKLVGCGAKRESEGTTELLKVFKQVEKKNKACIHEFYAGYGYEQTKIADILSSADVYLDAQKWGGWNNTLAEAMAVGCASVGTDIMGNMDFCVNRENCLMVRVDDIGGMVNAVTELLIDPKLRSKISKNAKKTMEKYTWENAAIQMEKALEAML